MTTETTPDTPDPRHSSPIVRTTLTPLADLHPHPDNPNNGDTDAIMESLRTNGQYRQIVARVDGTILAGHHVYAAALELGWTHLQVSFVDVDDIRAKAILVADNRIADLGPGVDLGLLVPLLDEIAAHDAELLAATGHTAQDLENFHTLLGGDWDDQQDQDGGGSPNEASFWPKITMQVAPHIFDAWRKLLDTYEGETDTVKLVAHLRALGHLDPGPAR